MSDALIAKTFADFLERNKYKSWMTGETLQAIRQLESELVSAVGESAESQVSVIGFRKTLIGE